MDRPRLLLVFLELFGLKGGIQVFSQFFLRAILEQFPNLTIDLILLQDQEVPEDLDPRVSVTLCGHPNRWVSRFNVIATFLQRIYDHKPQAIIIGHVNLSGLGALAQWIWEIPYLVITHGVEVWTPLNSFSSQGLHRARQVIAVSRFTRDKLISIQGLHPNLIPILPNTYDEERFVPRLPEQVADLRARQGWTGKKIIFTVCRLSAEEQYKGYDLVIRALPLVLAQEPNAIYLLGGKGDDRARIERLVQDLGLTDQVQLLGFIADQDLADYYALADVFIMPSLGEGFGIVFLEAMACNTPAIAGNQDGSVDPLLDGRLGTLVDPTSVEAIAEALITVLGQPRPNLQPLVQRYFGFNAYRDQVARILRGL